MPEAGIPGFVFHPDNNIKRENVKYENIYIHPLKNGAN